MDKRDCENCCHYVLLNSGDGKPGKCYSCEKWECDFEKKGPVNNLVQKTTS